MDRIFIVFFCRENTASSGQTAAFFLHPGRLRIDQINSKSIQYVISKRDNFEGESSH